MASIRKEIVIDACTDRTWEALRDVGALHTRLAPGFVVDTRLGDGERFVTFANGATIRELIVDVDDSARRVAWSAVGGSLIHHNAAAQVFAEGDYRTRFVWTADLLPHEAAPAIAGMIELGLAAIRSHLEATETGKG